MLDKVLRLTPIATGISVTYAVTDSNPAHLRIQPVSPSRIAGSPRLPRRPPLSPSMSLRQLDHGYWYATELKQFAETLGIPSAARLRKDELEHAIRQFLRSGRIIRFSNRRRSKSTAAERDVDAGLHLDRRVIHYTNDVATKEFLEREARRLAPGLRRRSGARYRLNRWREKQLANGVELTYRNVVEEYVRLNQSTEPFARVPHGRYINFLSEFLSREAGATRGEAIAAWHVLKRMDCPKTYRAWLKARSKGCRDGHPAPSTLDTRVLRRRPQFTGAG
ncbi:MAG: hypothetical protein ABIQ52_15415 [Vicinamibacterales bacterium]